MPPEVAALPAAQRAERAKVINTFLAGGARLIDTAPSYGSAESVVGDLLAELKVRDKVFLATKVRSNDNAAFVAQMKESQQRLRSPKFTASTTSPPQKPPMVNFASLS